MALPPHESLSTQGLSHVLIASVANVPVRQGLDEVDVEVLQLRRAPFAQVELLIFYDVAFPFSFVVTGSRRCFLL